MNPFDQFDAPVATAPPPAVTAAPVATTAQPPAASAGNPFDQFDVVPAPPPQNSGMLKNLAAGVVEGSGGVMNTIADPFGNIVGKPLATIGVAAHDALASTLGYKQFTPEQRAELLGDDVPQPGTKVINAIGNAIGASPSDVVAATPAQGVARDVGAGASSMAAFGAAPGMSVVRGLVINPLLGASGALTGDAASAIAPEPYKPLAQMVGNVAGMEAPRVVASGVRAAAAPLNALAPAFGRPAPLVDPATGAPILGADQTPLKATPGQALAAGQKLAADATDPVAVQAALDNPPAPAIPGEPLSTAQLTGDRGLAAAEFTASKTGTPQQQAAYRAHADAQNDARVKVLQDQASAADPAALSDALKSHAAAVDASTAAAVDQAKTDAAAQVANTVAPVQAHATGLQDAANEHVSTLGGDLPKGSEGKIGQSLRAPLIAADDAAHAQEISAWNAVDPDGTLAVDMTPIKQGAAAILADRSSLEAPLNEKEAGIFHAVGGMDNVMSFKDMAALRSRLTNSIRQERLSPTGDPEAVRRMSMLLDNVQDAMEPDNNAPSTNAPPQPGPGAPTSQSAPQVPSAAATPGGLTANFDADAQARYAQARALTAARKGGFEGAPGVKSALQSGPTSGSFKTVDAGVPASIIRTDPSGADHAKVYLSKGGDPQALTDAAAFSLRREAMRPDGTLDPAKYAKWAKDRDSFLSAIPDAQAKFGAAADAQRAADAGSANASRTLKDATAAAQKTIDQATDNRTTAIKAVQSSAIGKFLGDADPVARVWSILNDKNLGQASARTLADTIKNSPEAQAGLQRAAAQAIERNLVGTAKGATSQEALIQNNKFQTFWKHAEPALKEIMTPEQMAGLRNVSASLDRSMRSSQVGAGSPTAQLTADRQPGLVKQVASKVLGMGSGASLGGTIGAAVAGSAGAFVGSNIGSAAAQVIQSAREAGIKNVSDLRTEALLNPALYKLLTSKITPANQNTVLTGVSNELRKISMVASASNTVSSQQQRKRMPASPALSAPRNELLR